MLPFPSIISRRLKLNSHVILTLLLMAVPGMVYFGILQTIPQLITGATSAILFDLCFRALRRTKLFFSTSALITGLIVAMVLAPGTPWIVILFASLLAITAKHLIRVNARPLFNPANLGLFAAQAIFPASIHSWWGDTLPLVTVALGLLLLWRMARFHHLLAFIGTQVVLTLERVLLGNITLSALLPVALTTLSPFFLFIMLVEPVTAPAQHIGRIRHGALVAILSFISALLRFPAPLHLGLAVANVLTPFINRMPAHIFRELFPQRSKFPT